MSVALSDVARVRQTFRAEPQRKSVFDKCHRYTRAEEARQSGMYPYFFAIEETEGTEVEIDGRRLVMLGSNNYLGLTMDPRVKQASHDALETYGTSCSGSRFLNGTLKLHDELEERLAAWLGKEAALVATTGYTTNMIMGCLMGRGEIALMDISNHASLYEAVQTGFSTMKRFGHCDAADLRRRLERLDADRAKLLITDGVFSMEGDLAPLREYVELKREYGFPIVVDDAHGLGVLGEHGRGTCELLGVEDDIDIVTGTFSKAFASVGGVIAGPAKVIDFVKHNGRAMVFSASMSPPALGAALKSLELLQEEGWRRRQVMDNATYMRTELDRLGFAVCDAESPVVALHIGDEGLAFMTWKRLFDEGLFTNLAVPPGVPPGKSLVRTSYMATHTRDQLDRALEVFARVGRQLELI